MDNKKTRAHILKYLGSVAMASFSLNLIWEVLHSPLYDWNKPPLDSCAEVYILRILQSTFGDMVFITAIVALILFIKIIFFKKKSLSGRPDRFAAGIALLLLAFFVEGHAIGAGRWSYLPIMPTLSDLGLYFNVGLTPLVQLAVTGIVSLWAAKKIVKNIK